MTDNCLPSSADVNILRAVVDINFKGKEKRFAPAINLLTHVLYKMYNVVSMDILKAREDNLNEPLLFSQAIEVVVAECEWKNTTASATVGYLRQLLRRTSIKESFIKRITFTTGKPAPKTQDNDRWLLLIQKHTRIKSQITIDRMCKFLNKIESLVTEDTHMSEDMISNLCGKCNQRKVWLEFYMHHVLDRLKFSIEKTMTRFSSSEEVGDKHRIPKHELEMLQSAATKNVRSELLFMLMISTGMRVGGLVRIKSEHVLTIRDNEITVKNMGKTIEKGSKWFSFIISDRCKELIQIWYKNHRPAVQSPYLFPSTKKGQQHITTCSVYAIFKGICKDAGLEGHHLHPHALRHSYAHILLEAGNSPEIIAKMLGHSSVNITENFYLRENAEEIVNRANIPWLQREKPASSIPNFLNPKRKTQEVPEKRKRGMLKMVQFVNEQMSNKQ
jgi:integrase/recombinase XerD